MTNMIADVCIRAIFDITFVAVADTSAKFSANGSLSVGNGVTRLISNLCLAWHYQIKNYTISDIYNNCQSPKDWGHRSFNLHARDKIQSGAVTIEPSYWRVQSISVPVSSQDIWIHLRQEGYPAYKTQTNYNADLGSAVETTTIHGKVWTTK